MTELHPIALFHYVVGTVAVFSGFLAMFSSKGCRLHKGAGQLFFLAMLLLVLSAFYLSYTRQLQFTFLLSALTLYLVLVGWYAIKRTSHTVNWMDILGFAYIVIFTLGGLLIAVLGTLLEWQYPASEPPYSGYLSLVAISVFFAFGDFRLIRCKQAHDKVWLKRHINRMCFAMLIATTIFFLGNNHVLPDILRNAYVLITPVVTVIVVTLVYSLGFKRFFKRPAALRKPG